MNKGWKYLMYAGIVFLIAAVAWEAYSVASGDRSNFSVVVLGMPKTTLFTPTMEAHLNSGITLNSDPILEEGVVSFPGQL